MPATANGVLLTALSVKLPLLGTWDATFTADTTDASKVNGRVVLELDGIRLTGTGSAGADGGGKVTGRIVAGANGLDGIVAPRSYTSTTVRIVAQDICRDCGETLASDADSATVSRTLDGWVRTKQSGRDALKRLADFLGVSWRAKLDGSIWLGPETWPTVTPDVVVAADEPTQNYVDVAIEGFDVLPGQTFRSSRISLAEYRLDGSKLRLRAQSGSARSEAADLLSQMIKRETQTDYFAMYPGRVVAQNSDGTLEVKVDSPRIPGMSKLPIRHGLPGVTSLEVATGARVLVGFEGADPSRPFACLWEGASNLTRIRYGGIHEFDGTEAVALASGVDARLAAIERWGPTVTPPLTPATDTIASESLFAK